MRIWKKLGKLKQKFKWYYFWDKCTVSNCNLKMYDFYLCYVNVYNGTIFTDQEYIHDGERIRPVTLMNRYLENTSLIFEESKLLRSIGLRMFNTNRYYECDAKKDYTGDVKELKKSFLNYGMKHIYHYMEKGMHLREDLNN